MTKGVTWEAIESWDSISDLDLLEREKSEVASLAGRILRVVMNRRTFTKPENRKTMSAKMVVAKGTSRPDQAKKREIAMGRISVV